MAVASFEELCAGFCEIVKVPQPRLKADARGLVAFHVVMRGATVNLIHRPDETTDHVFVLFELGPLPLDAADSFTRMRELLEANYALLQLYPPTYSRNPATGDALLQYVYPLFDATPSGLHELIERGLDVVSQWQDNPFPRDPSMTELQVPHTLPFAMLNRA